jgi:hypothetical protein
MAASDSDMSRAADTATALHCTAPHRKCFGSFLATLNHRDERNKRWAARARTR